MKVKHEKKETGENSQSVCGKCGKNNENSGVKCGIQKIALKKREKISTKCWSNKWSDEKT